MELMEIFREFAQLAGPTAMRALWQGGILTVALALAVRLAPRLSASDRFRIWSAAFAALVAIPFLPLLNTLSLGSLAASATAGPAPSDALIHIDPRWGLAITGLWLALSAWRAIDLLAHSWRLRRLWKNAVPVAVPAAGYEVCSTRELDRPSVIGFFAPRILIPDWLLERLSPEELEQVILHEAEHLHRRDDWTNLVQKLALVVFPVNPALVWVERRLCREREMACDEGVIRRTQAPRAYAACLASLAERGLERRAEALSLGAWQRRPELVERVHRILRRGPVLHPAAARALLVVVGCGLFAGSVEFARCPQLIAFTAAPTQAQLAQADEGDAVIHPDAVPGAGQMLTATRPGEGYHAVNAIAQVPSRAESAAARAHQMRIEGRRTVARPARAILSEPRREMATADRKPLSAAAPQQWVVFTAWEQIETTTQAAPISAQAKATHAGNAAASAAQGDVVVDAARQITVTRMFLTVYSTGSAKAGRGAKSSATPAMQQSFPLRDGWLVFQL
ncbi:MAG: M56 family metallopeptidase [Acidobacteriota bacterium]